MGGRVDRHTTRDLCCHFGSRSVCCLLNLPPTLRFVFSGCRGRVKGLGVCLALQCASPPAAVKSRVCRALGWVGGSDLPRTCVAAKLVPVDPTDFQTQLDRFGTSVFFAALGGRLGSFTAPMRGAGWLRPTHLTFVGSAAKPENVGTRLQHKVFQFESNVGTPGRSPQTKLLIGQPLVFFPFLPPSFVSLQKGYTGVPRIPGTSPGFRLP